MSEKKLHQQLIGTTHLVGQTIISEQALRGMAHDISNSNRKPVVLVDHDSVSPPLGQTLFGTVVELEDGHHGLVVEWELFDTPIESQLPDGAAGLKMSSSIKQYPLTIAQHDPPDKNQILVDPVNLGGFEETEAFFRELRDAGFTEFESGWQERRSLLPDPVVIFELTASTSAAWFGLRIANAAGKAIEPQITAFFEAMFGAIRSSTARLLPFTRPITYVLKVHGHPNLQFVAETRDAEKAVKAFSETEMSSLKPIIDSARDNFSAEMIQFILDKDGKWRLNFLVSSNGDTIGTLKAFDRRNARLAEVDRIARLPENAEQSDGHEAADRPL